MSRITHVHADPDEWVVVHRDSSDGDGDGEGCLACLAIVGVLILLEAIPGWVWITLGVLLLVGGAIWVLSKLGAFDGSGSKPVEIPAKTAVVPVPAAAVSAPCAGSARRKKGRRRPRRDGVYRPSRSSRGSNRRGREHGR